MVPLWVLSPVAAGPVALLPVSGGVVAYGHRKKPKTPNARLLRRTIVVYEF